jgi:hypothetical protein
MEIAGVIARNLLADESKAKTPEWSSRRRTRTRRRLSVVLARLNPGRYGIGARDAATAVDFGEHALNIACRIVVSRRFADRSEFTLDISNRFTFEHEGSLTELL